MLRELEIKDILLIKRLSLEFSSGLNAFTGETGTGKSILFNKKTIPRITTKAKANFTIKPRMLVLKLVFFINCI